MCVSLLLTRTKFISRKSELRSILVSFGLMILFFSSPKVFVCFISYLFKCCFLLNCLFCCYFCQKIESNQFFCSKVMLILSTFTFSIVFYLNFITLVKENIFMQRYDPTTVEYVGQRSPTQPNML